LILKQGYPISIATMFRKQMWRRRYGAVEKIDLDAKDRELRLAALRVGGTCGSYMCQIQSQTVYS